MKLTDQIINQFNLEDALLVISSFPSEGGEVASDNAICRYTKLLLSAFPANRKIVVVCEKREKTDPYIINGNILVMPTYTLGNPLMFLQMEKIIRQFSKISSINLQFEFSIYGGKITLFPLIFYLCSLKGRGKFVSIAIHQVSNDLNELSAHLGIKRHGFKVFVLNRFLSIFYKFMNLSANAFIVHDNFLKKRLSKHVSLNKIFVIAHGSESYQGLSPFLRASSREKFGVKKDEFIVLAFGYRSAYKGTDFIVSCLSRIAKENPRLKIRLLLAGGESPTLRGTLSYFQFSKKLNRLINLDKKNVISLAFVAESEVKSVFAASDLVVFPYRARMSASGALSLAFQYAKPILVSQKFSSNFEESDIQNSLKNYLINKESIIFSMRKRSLESRLINLIKDTDLQKKLSLAGAEISMGRSWNLVSLKYDFVCINPAVLSGTTLYSPEFVRE
ncbi:MAG: hypothetical protein HY044_00165 [Candidatus Woesebacteria bacterium]|nr:MAG: hypothetical protein HY044_00165 [Candidatus Woesebacteria bacterium]